MEVLAQEVKVDATNVTLVTTAETLIISSNPMAQERPIVTYFIQAWAKITTGTNITTVLPLIKRGAATTGTLVNESNVVTAGAAAGSNEIFSAWATDTRSDISQAQYCLTLTQAGADGNGTVLESGITVTQLC